MQKILALLLIIGLTNAIGKGEGGVDVLSQESNGIGMGNVGAVKNVSDKLQGRIMEGEQKGNETQLVNAVETFDTCMMNAKDDTDKDNCFSDSMKVFLQAGSPEEKAIAGLAKNIIGCKKGEEDIGECIMEASDGLEGDAKETVKIINEVLTTQKEIKKIMEEEEAKFNENYTCEDVVMKDEEGNNITTQKCKPTEAYQKILDKLQQEAEEEFARRTKVEEIKITIDDEEQNLKIYRPTEEAIKEQIEQNNKTVEELQKALKEEGEKKLTAEEKVIIQNIIDAIKADNHELQKPQETVKVLKEKIEEQIKTVNGALKKIAENENE